MYTQYSILGSLFPYMKDFCFMIYFDKHEDMYVLSPKYSFSSLVVFVLINFISKTYLSGKFVI